MVCHPPILCWNMCQVLDLVEHCFRKLNAVLGVFIFKPTLGKSLGNSADFVAMQSNEE